jgi:hypothetical protein
MNEPIDLTEYSHDIHEVYKNIFQEIESNAILYLKTTHSIILFPFPPSTPPQKKINEIFRAL